MFESLNVVQVPLRVFEICKCVCETPDKHIPEKELAEKIEPGEKDLFSSVLSAAKATGLIDEQNGEIRYIGEDSMVHSIDSFRRYGNSCFWNDENTKGFRIASALLSLDELPAKCILSSPELVKEVKQNGGFGPENIDKDLLAMRFWLGFLGFGFRNEKNGLYFIPNMYVALNDFISNRNVTRGKKISMEQFFNELKPGASVFITSKNRVDLSMNLALSLALKELQENGEISLFKEQDSEKVWRMKRIIPEPGSEIVTHILVK